jgi:hypothetical protein
LCTKTVGIIVDIPGLLFELRPEGSDHVSGMKNRGLKAPKMHYVGRRAAISRAHSLNTTRDHTGEN